MPSAPIPGWTLDASPFHAGEVQVHERLGIRTSIENRVRKAGIRNYMLDQHRQFFSQLPFLVVASTDRSGQPWATLRVGRPGFVTTPDARTMHIAAKPLPGDPLGTLDVGAFIGALGIELPTRRRNRVNGTVTGANKSGLRVAVSQSFGNCSKYVQSRNPQLIEDDPQLSGNAFTQDSNDLSDADRNLICAADTFFIASANLDPDAGVARGVDVSHKGGRAGFIRIDDARTLTIPDFAGNSYFNTLGNLLCEPRAGLLFIDFGCGDLLYLAGKAEIIWDGPEVQAFIGAQRMVRVHLTHVRRCTKALPVRWSQPQYASELANTGAW